MIVINVKQVV